jgi:YVTN family beta-propeller protein
MNCLADLHKNGARAAQLAAVVILFLVCISCGDTYRPVAVPVTPNPPDPASLHFVLVLNSNGPNNVGTTTRIDVSGDTNVGVTKIGLGPVHAALTSNAARVYVANSLEDTVSAYAPGAPSVVVTVSLPTGSTPVFVHSTESGTMYSANAGNGTVSAISVASNVVTNTIPVGTNPVGLAETPDATKLYVVNQGSGSISRIVTQDKSVATIVTGLNSPVWAVARGDSQRVYVLSSGDGALTAIDTASDLPVANSVSAGAGANYVFYDKHFNRIYVTNPANSTVSIVDVSADPPQLLTTIDLTAAALGANACPGGCTPVSVAVLPDGSRAYVASYNKGIDPSNGAINLTAQVSVIDAGTLAVTHLLPLGSVDVDTSNPTGCSSDAAPGSLRTALFRLSIAAAADSSKVFVSNCDAGYTSIIDTSTDTVAQGQQFQVQPTNPLTCALITAPLIVAAPTSAFAPTSTICEILPPPQNDTFFTVPPPQNPVFVLLGQ